MQVTLLHPDDPRWGDALHAIPHDVYHLPGYAELSAKNEGGSAVAFLMEDQSCQCLIPLIIRPLPASLGLNENWCDATSPYGYPGPIASAHATAGDWNRCLNAFVRAAEERDIVTAFVRWNPLLESSRESLLDCERRVCHGETAYCRLDETEEEWESQTRSGHMYNIRKLLRDGYRVEMDDWSFLQEFVSMYHDTMRRLGSDEYYIFGMDYFRDLQQALGEGLHIGCVMSPRGELAAASLFMECNGIVQYHLSGVAESFLKVAPTKLLLHSVRTWAKSRGNQLFHLGGGVGGRCDSLFQFKSGFTRHRGTFHTSRLILSEQRFAEAVQRAKCPPETSFFPAYRRAV